MAVANGAIAHPVVAWKLEVVSATTWVAGDSMAVVAGVVVLGVVAPRESPHRQVVLLP